jgi:hypothetical protein
MFVLKVANKAVMTVLDEAAAAIRALREKP